MSEITALIDLQEWLDLKTENKQLRNALIQARGALRLDHMVDDEGQPYGTTTVALEAIDAALARE